MILPPPGFKQPISDPSLPILITQELYDLARGQRAFMGTLVIHDVRDPALQLAGKEPKCST